MKKLLHVDDDLAFAEILKRRLERHGWQSEIYTDTVSALRHNEKLDAILLDLNLNNEASLPTIPDFKSNWPQARIVMLTGYASIASTVAAIKLGADDYLAKPVELHQLIQVLAPNDSHSEYEMGQPLSPDRLEWELIQRTLQQNRGNISATARALNMHRRTLQRKLQKRPTNRLS
ncbi:response regulator transcription factor [Aliidiomarina celeris]|uniref:response regulator transcription factor n=1 Tax=Aliidiomarina celeris TaxID=2249428 RepID=UPI000DE851CF|nr:response regulator [Aliidiomarina celeris]